MRSIVSFPGTMAHAQHIARALYEHDLLLAFVTTAHFQQDGLARKFVRLAPARARTAIGRQLARRSVSQVPDSLVNAHPAWELLRMAADKAGAGTVLTDMAWDVAAHRFDALVARRYVQRAEAVHAFEYTALSSFEAAERLGVARVLHLPALDNAHFNAVRGRELADWPELATPADAHFDRLFERRQARRHREIELADVVVCNSSLTARSHIAAGADPAKVLVVPLGAPPAISDTAIRADTHLGPLRVIYAGPFSLRKGAHHLVEAWRRLKAGNHARLDVYGSLQVPRRLLDKLGEGTTLHGSVPQAELFQAFEEADVLVFPTLSDGFGLVVTEAMAHGLPVITTDQAGAADLVTPENGLVVPAADAAKLADALRWCLDNRERLAAMRTGALATARTRQWSDFRRELIAGLGPALARRGGMTDRVAEGVHAT